jgi:hypothetical protein
MKRLLLSSAAVAALTFPAFSADLGGAVDYSEPAYTQSAAAWAAYFDIHGGYGFGDESGTTDKIGFSDYDEDWDETLVGAALRGAYFVSPAFSIQGDVWANRYDGNSDSGIFDFETIYVGTGGHLTYNAAPGTLLGAVASYGWMFEDGDDSSDFVNVGLEAAHEVGNFRAYGQAGYTFGVNGFADDVSLETWYGVGELTYYFTDNFALSGNVGYSQTDSDAFNEDGWTWGTTIEAKPWNAPISLYGSYQGYQWDGEDFAFDYDGTDHTFFVGAKFMANSGSVRERDQTVGLKDMNPIFGDFP